MPPKRRAATSNSAGSTKRSSKLAKENNITADQEADIREAFGLFAVQHPDYPDAKEGMLRAEDVRRCLIALDLPPSPSSLPSILSTIDPLSSGFIPLTPFLSYAALALRSKSELDSDDEVFPRTTYTHDAEVLAAYKLFTHGDPGPITLSHLRRVAKELREEVPDNVLRDMILEANGGVKGPGNAGTVGLEDFEEVMRRAGVFG
ncbi:hypothetical protein AOQ84DRAFT_351578 [Glonium stellatum]|uniref:EF-hand superfamily Ca2+-modulated protein n=1 Tax=Glonium stellatum TaxID=574774 RepID=A0A8E2JYH0_9PEZI|nr:hypothetical protein AOQ84DRAFT_351578 [Glonium stellatum]